MKTDRDAYLRQPREVSLETLALCNARCTFCPYPTLERKGTKMETSLIIDLIGQMKHWSEPFFISPFKVNEPLLDERLKDLCGLIEDQIPQANLRLFTNGSPLTDRHIDWIAPLKSLDCLWVSLNEVDAQTYGEVMGLSLSVTLSRLDNLHARSCGSKRTFAHRVYVSRVSDREPGDTFAYSPRDMDFLRFVFNRWPRFEGRIIKRDGWLGYVEPSTVTIPTTRCLRWWELNICADGNVALCCMDGKGEFSIGNVNAKPLLDIYNQPHLLERRQRSANKGRTGIDPCQRCTY